MKTLGPGIYEMTMEEYIAYPAVSRTVLVDTLISPAHGLASMKFPKDTTDAMRLGTATHMAFLEPGEVPKHFAVYMGKPNEKTGKIPKQIVRRGEHWEAHQASAKSQGLDPYLTVSQYEEALSMGRALRLNPDSAALFAREPFQREVVILFTKKIKVGKKTIVIPIKVRIDSLITDEYPTEADVKTAKSVADRSFINSIIEYGYDIQSWLYREAFIASTEIKVTNFVIAAVEKDKRIMDPRTGELTHAVRVIEMKRWLKGGEQRGLEALSILAKCKADNYWPAYPDGVEELEPPSWYQTQHGGVTGGRR